MFLVPRSGFFVAQRDAENPKTGNHEPRTKEMKLSLITALLLAPLTVLHAAELVEVRKIWDEAPHNAFTDLLRFQDRWFCVFREGSAHNSPDGAVRVITSTDGVKWESASLMRMTPETFSGLKPRNPLRDSYLDLRDPHLCLTPDGRLMLNSCLTYNKGRNWQSLFWLSDDGRNWGAPVLIAEPQDWLWRVTWHKGKAYGVGRVPTERIPRLYQSEDGRRFEVLVKDADFFPLVPGPSEATIRFLPDETALCLMRLNRMPGSKTDHAHLGTARPPYTRWTWKDLSKPIGGPDLITLPDHRLIAAVRLYDGKIRTALCWLDPQAGTMEEFLALPSGGNVSNSHDTSYAGLVYREGLLWVSYYSAHEGKAAIYLARVKL
jgi:hypothetical protein